MHRQAKPNQQVLHFLPVRADVPDHSVASDGLHRMVLGQLGTRVQEEVSTDLAPPDSRLSNPNRTQLTPSCADVVRLFSLDVSGLENSLHNQRISQDSSHETTLSIAHHNIRMMGGNGPQDFSSGREKVHSKRLDKAKAREPAVLGPIKVRTIPFVVLEGALHRHQLDVVQGKQHLQLSPKPIQHALPLRQAEVARHVQDYKFGLRTHLCENPI